MRTLNQEITVMVCFGLLSTIQTWAYTNPIDGSATETVTNLWNLGSDSLQVGLTTGGNALIITNGGRVESGGGKLGTGGYSYNNQVVVRGAGSTWVSSGEVLLASKNNELLITDGGRVDSVSGQVGGIDRDNNRVLISGSGSIWSNSASLLIGTAGTSNAVIVSNGGKLYSSSCEVGDQPSNLSRIVVTGSGSIFKSGTSLYIGHRSEMVVDNGGKVEGD